MSGKCFRSKVWWWRICEMYFFSGFLGRGEIFLGWRGVGGYCFVLKVVWGYEIRGRRG